MPAWRVHVSASTASGGGGWAWRVVSPDGQSTDGQGAEPGATAWRLRLLGTVDALQAIPPGAEAEVRSTDAAFVDTGSKWLKRWQANHWKRDGRPLQDLDLLKPLASLTDDRKVAWVRLAHRDQPDDVAVSAHAKAAARPGGAPEAPKSTSADPATGEQAKPKAAPKARKSAVPVVEAPMPNVTLLGYTDGGCRGNPGPGGWGFVLVHLATGTTLLSRGGAPLTTNNRMELGAVLELLRSMTRPGQAVEIRVDSKLVMNICEKWMKGWKRRGWRKPDDEPPANLDLLKDLDVELARHKVRFSWVPGHSGEAGNEQADQLTNDAMNDVQAGRDALKAERLAAPPFRIPGVPIDG